MTERTAIVRVDAEPDGEHVQGVWLELASGARWVIAYRAHALWTAFADRRVVVTGHCYEPVGQAIGAPHYHVDTLRPVEPGDARQFLAVYPERLASGMVVVAEAAAGSKLAASGREQFRDRDGTASWIAGSDGALVVGRAITARVRAVELSRAWAASPGGDHVWIGATADE